MKIVSVDEVKDFRIFSKWSPDKDSPPFDHVTLVHANNGSGKSTLASLLNPVTSAGAWQAGATITVSEGDVTRRVTEPDDLCWQNVVVFDAHYVENSVRVKEGATKALLALGLDAVQRQRDLETAQAALEDATDALGINRGDKRTAEAAEKTLLRAIGTEVFNALKVRPEYGRGYDARQVRKEIDTALGDDERADLDELALLERARARQEDPVREPRDLPATPLTLAEVRTLISEIPSASSIEMSKMPLHVRDWLAVGVELHQSLDHCTFCTGVVTRDRLDALGQLLSEAESSLSERARQAARKLEDHVELVRSAIQGLPPEGARVYADLRERYTTAREDLVKSCEHYCAMLELAQSALMNKAQNVHSTPALALNVASEGDSTHPRVNISEDWPSIDLTPLRSAIAEHNTRTAEFECQVSEDAALYKRFIFGKHLAQYRTLRAEIDELQTKETTLDTQIRQLKGRVQDLSGGEFDPGPGVKWINDELCRLLGRDELQLEVLDDQNYAITRHGAKVDHLSEGEKTALALLHFLGSLENKGRDPRDLCVVIDDPISSLDDSIAFGASAALWGYLLGVMVCRCGNGPSCQCKQGRRMRVDQVIVLTHNFEFFRNWSNQLDRLPSGLVSKAGLSYVQLELRSSWMKDDAGVTRRIPKWSTFGTTGRPTKSNNDPELALRTRLRSEYHYLFNRCATTLTQLIGGSASIADQMDAESLLPNASRRLLEGFLAHRYPEQMGRKFRDSLKAGLPDDADNPTRVILDSYLNRFSHNEEASMGTALHRPEAAKMLTFVFDYIHRLDPRHFHGMCNALHLDPDDLLAARSTAFSQAEIAGRTPCAEDNCPHQRWQTVDDITPDRARVPV
ncbi:AAA family ATPase [Rhodococcus opacus]|uniref:AAA family ATPase n=1 Tax=Rhodococcus opacus TaxID=37919 RepID=A0ABT4NP53_RHOOP|nr:AAA family ATPase [Rhodococcus opacus]MCZ4589165.1 AAA family ATPase [Rhodococcus opacus]